MCDRVNAGGMEQERARFWKIAQSATGTVCVTMMVVGFVWAVTIYFLGGNVYGNVTWRFYPEDY